MNRIPTKHRGEQPRCGSCKQILIDGQPVALDERNFERFVTRSELPIVVDFWAGWCGACKMKAPVFAQTAARLAPDVLLAKVDSEAAPLVASHIAAV